MIRILKKILGISKLEQEIESLRNENNKLKDELELKEFEAFRWRKVSNIHYLNLEDYKDILWKEIQREEWGYCFFNKIREKSRIESIEMDKWLWEELKNTYGDKFEELEKRWLGHK